MNSTTVAPGISPFKTLNNDDLGQDIIIASWVLTVSAALFLFTRVGAKLWTRRGLWADDYVLIIAWVRIF